MIDLLIAHPVRALVAVLIGLATAWWIWGRLGNGVADTAGKTSAAAGVSVAAETAPEKAKEKPRLCGREHLFVTAAGLIIDKA